MRVLLRTTFLLAVFATASLGAVIIATTSLTAAAENPPNPSTGTGTATITYDDLLHTLRVQVEFEGLTGTTTVAHIHCCIAAPGNVGVATRLPTFEGFPEGVTEGSYDATISLTDPASFNPAFVTAWGGTVEGAEEALIAGLWAGQAYLNVHTSFRPGGEIRGFIHFVPEPGSIVLMGSGLLALGLLGYRRRSSMGK